MNILLLGPSRPPLEEFLSASGDYVTRQEEALTRDAPNLRNADFLVSFGFRFIIREDILEKFQKRAINLHISFLPWNRGADPNLWSFLDDTPKGVSVHYLDKGIDTGDILCQKEIAFTREKTLRETYNRLCAEMEMLFQESWPLIRRGEMHAKAQLMKGTTHFKADRKTYEHLLTQGWDTAVSSLVGKSLPQKRTAR